MFYLSSLNKLFNISIIKLLSLILLLVIYAFLEIVGIGFLVAIISDIVNSNQNCLFNYEIFNINKLCKLKKQSLLLLVILFFLFKFLFQSFTYYYRIKILSDGINNFLTQNFLKFINFKPDILEKFNFFESNTILIKEIENVFMSFADKILDFISEFFVFLSLSIIFVIILYNLKLIPVLAIIIFFIFFIFFLSKKTKNIGTQRTDSLIGLNKDFYEIFKNLDILNVFEKNSEFIKLVESKIINYKKSIKYSNLIRQLPKFFFEFFIIFCLLLFVLFSKKTFNGDFAILAALSLIFLRLYPSITRMKVSYDSAIFNKYSATKTINLLNEIFSIKYNGKSIETKNDNIMKIEKLSISKNNKIIINSANIKINKKDKILLQGETGSGKSTFLKFLSGNQIGDNFYFSENYENSVKFSNYYLKINKISYIPQNPILFNFSIAKNVSLELDNTKINYDKIINLFNELKLEKFIDKLDKNLSMDGSSISGGERQRISIARGFYNDPNFIVMDEPFSSVDSNTRNLVSSFIKKISKEKTLIISSHNTESIDLYNKILIMNDGKIYEE